MQFTSAGRRVTDRRAIQYFPGYDGSRGYWAYTIISRDGAR
jgi:hypothetical protein